MLGGVKVYCSRMSYPFVVLLAAAAVVLLAVLAGGFLLARHREQAIRRVEGLFRRPPKPAKGPGRDHYYKPYWS